MVKKISYLNKGKLLTPAEKRRSIFQQRDDIFLDSIDELVGLGGSLCLLGSGETGKEGNFDLFAECLDEEVYACSGECVFLIDWSVSFLCFV